MVAKQEPIIKLLTEHGATISSGDVSHYACYAVEQNNMENVKLGGDVTLVNTTGTTALHTAISQENVEMVKFLLDSGSDVNKPDVHGWTPQLRKRSRITKGMRILKGLFKTIAEGKSVVLDALSPKRKDAPYLKKNFSVPTSPPGSQEGRTSAFSEPAGSSHHGRARRRAHNLFGIMSAAAHRVKLK